MGLHVQYGCGLSAPEGWINFDSSPTLRIERAPLIGRLLPRRVFPQGVRYGDILRGLPVAQARGVYASHVLEHLSREDFETALANTYAILAPGGIFRLIVPDLEARARAYLDRVKSGVGNDWFMRAALLGIEEKRTSGRRLLGALGNSHHLWMWDWPSMGTALGRAGFVSIRRCRFGDCQDAAFRAVEDISRFHDQNYDIEELAVEARRPEC
jgi:hypothetical protein